MNKGQLPKLLFAGGVLLAIALAVFYYFFSVSTAAYAEVVQLQGQAELLTPKAASRLLTVGDRLDAGSHIKTAENSMLTLMFVDHSVLRVSEQSDLIVSRLLRSYDSQRAETVIDINEGRAESHVQKLNGFGAKYEVRTLAIQLSVRGTEFTVGVDQKRGLTTTMVNEGRVAAVAGAEEIVLESGFGIVASVEGGMEALRQLLKAPDIQALAEVEQYLPLHIRWPSRAEDTAYRVQLFSVANEAERIHDRVYPHAEVVLDELADRDYLLKVRRIDAMGLEGQAAEQHFTLNAHPLPPKLTFPLSEQLTAQTVRFTWEPSSEAQNYLFQISDTADFSHVNAQIKDLPGHLKQMPVWLKPGHYYWRIASYHPDEGMGPFTPAQPFTIEPATN